MSKQMAELFSRVTTHTKALEDKSHRLSRRNRNQFGTKTNRTNTNKSAAGRDDDRDDYSASFNIKKRRARSLCSTRG